MKKIIRATTVPHSLEMFCTGMLKELSERYEVIGLASPGEALNRVSEREGVRTIAVPMERRIAIRKDIRSLSQLCKVFSKEKPYMVHSMTPKAGLLCMIAGWLTRVPVRIHTVTGLVWPTSTGLKRIILKLSDKLTCACATHIIPEGEGVKNDLIAGKITKKPLKVLGFGNVMGVDMNYFSRFRVDGAGLRDTHYFTFLFVGRIVGDKGINELCEAFSQLHNQYPKTRLWLVGAFEDKLDPIKSETKKLINQPNNEIVAVGVKRGDELLAYYAASDCFVLPSYREGFPNTVLEAGAMELPCIVTDINGSREIIEEGVNGTIIPPKNKQALFHAMQIMLSNASMRKTMSGNARKMIADRFEQHYVRKCLYEFYSEIIK